MSDGWRTVIVESADALSLKNNCLVVTGEGETALPLSQLQRVLIASPRGTVSIPLLQELCRSQVEVVFCDEKFSPQSELIPLGNHTGTAGCIFRQMAWPQQRKDEVWQEITAAKIANQMANLELAGREIPEPMRESLCAVLPGDSTNREGLAARLYFSAYFGEEFIRHTDDTVNRALNYGYTILLSAMTRVITSYGYHTAIGIHHHSRSNRFNLSCDLMEPFRPAVDRFVFCNMDRELSWAYKKELLSVLKAACVYDGRKMPLETALEIYAQDVLGAMNDPERSIFSLTFV